MRSLWVMLAAAALVASAGRADAQGRRPAQGASAPQAASGYQGRGNDIYSRPSGSSGTIRWNTPNASGNLGGPSAGGGGSSR